MKRDTTPATTHPPHPTTPTLPAPPHPPSPSCPLASPQTDSKNVLMVSGTGHAGMEACITNLLQPGETIVVGNAGIWGARVCDMAGRYGAKVVELKVWDNGGRGAEVGEGVGGGHGPRVAARPLPPPPTHQPPPPRRPRAPRSPRIPWWPP